MSFLQLVITAVGCLVTQHAAADCLPASLQSAQVQAAPQPASGPVFTGEAVDVVLSAQAALVWDVQTGKILYESNADVRRPIASLTKLLSVLTIQDEFSASAVVEIPPDVLRAQRLGANIRLPVGHHASVSDLLAAGIIASANDAIVALAVTATGSEETFAETANHYARLHGYEDTVVANATGLAGGTQYSTARDVKALLSAVYQDPQLRPLLSQRQGVLRTTEGVQRSYTSTNELLGTYMPILAAKTGYTAEAGENLAVITMGEQQQPVGAVILGSTDRFFDMKVLVEWIWRNYTWPD